MAARKWLFRSLIVVVLAFMVGGSWWLRGRMDPALIRQQIVEQLEARLVGVEVEVGSASMRLFGGIAVRDLKLIRSDDPKRRPFLTIPSATIHPDKELLHQGRVVLRRVEVERPILIVERDSQGRFALETILRPDTKADGELAPTFIAHDGVIRFIDRRLGDGPWLEVKLTSAEILNEPGKASIRLDGSSGLTGPIELRGSWQAAGRILKGHLDLATIPLEASNRTSLATICPEIVSHLEGLTGKLAAHVDVEFQEGLRLKHRIAVELDNARYVHPMLPGPLEELTVRLHAQDGGIVLDKATAKIGSTRLSMTFEIPGGTGISWASLGGTGNLVDLFEERLAKLDLGVEGLELSAALIKRLPAQLTFVEPMFQPRGPIDAAYHFDREQGAALRRITIWPRGVRTVYENFRYPVESLRGSWMKEQMEGQLERIVFNLTGAIQGKPVTIVGTSTGSRPEVTMDLTITALDIDLDAGLIAALPDDYPAFVRKLRTKIHGDVACRIRQDAKIRREYGNDIFDNLFDIRIKQGSIDYELFPYPLNDISGRLILRSLPDQLTRLPEVPGTAVVRMTGAKEHHGSVEFRDFVGRHGSGLIRFSGKRQSKPGSSILDVDMSGERLPLDADWNAALRSLNLDKITTALDANGEMNCRVLAKITRHDGMPFDPRENLHVGMAFAGPQLRPAFFPYTLQGVSGRLGYAGGRVTLFDVKANHGPTQITLPLLEVNLPLIGGMSAKAEGLTINPLLIDHELGQALPWSARQALEGLRLRGRLGLRINACTINLPPEQAIANVAYRVDDINALKQASGARVEWDGTLFVEDGSIFTGVPWEGLRGYASCRGAYQAGVPQAIVGNLLFHEAKILGQPLKKLSTRFEIDPRDPEIMRFPWLNAELYGGELGGQGQVYLQSPPQFDLKLNATRIRLDEIAREQNLGPKVRLQGLATAALSLTNRDGNRLEPRSILQGSGSIDVNDGRMLNLPLTLDMLKVLNGRAPDETAFEEAHLLFFVRGNRLKFGQLDFIGKAISLGGEGEWNTTTNEMKLEFYTVWSNFIRKLSSEPIETVFNNLSRTLFKLKVEGVAGQSIDIRKEIVPAVSEPMKRVIQLIQGPTVAPRK